MRLTHFAYLVLALAAGAARADAQGPTVLLKDGDLIAPGLAVTRINRNDSNRVGGYVTLGVAQQAGGSEIAFAWGSPDGVAPPGVVFQEGLFAGLTQDNWRLAAKLDDAGRLGYQADLVGGLTSIWHHDVPIAIQGQPASVPGTWSSSLREAGVTDVGDPWFLDPAKGLFFGPNADPFYLRGDPLPGTADAIGWVRRFAFSSDSAHHLVTMNREAPSGTEVFVLDGAGLSVGGFLLETDVVLPPQLGGNGADVWDFVHGVDVNAAGEWCVFVRRLRSNGAVSDEILRDGQILYGKGQFLDGLLLTSVDTSGALTDRGELLHVWGNRTSGPQAIFVDGDRVVTEGQPVDLDGDGIVDPNTQLGRPGTVEPWDATLSEDGWLYFTAEVDVDVGPTVVTYDAFLRVPRSPAPVAYCTPKASSSGCATSLSTSDPSLAPIAWAGGYSLLASAVEGQRNGLFFWGTSGPVAQPFLGGTLCVLPPLKRGPIQTSGGLAGTCSGTFALELNAGDPWDLGPGRTLWWQAWYRDPDLADGFDVALSNAIEVQAR